MISSSVASGSPPPLVAPAVTATLNMVPKHTRVPFFILRRFSAFIPSLNRVSLNFTGLKQQRQF